MLDQLKNPIARTEDLITRDMEDEVLVCDMQRDEAITLNLFAARVWRACDGKSSVVAITRNLAAATPDAGIDEAAVWQALAMLEKSNLLQDRLVTPPAMLNRRNMLRYGIGAAAVVSMVALPNVAHASTCLAAGVSNPGCVASCCSFSCGCPSPSFQCRCN